MALSFCTLSGVSLPLNFKYNYVKPQRFAELKTLGGSQIQKGGFQDTDIKIAFSCDIVSASLKNSIDSLFQTGSSITFKDLDGTSHSVLIIEFHSIEEASYFNLTGILQKL